MYIHKAAKAQCYKEIIYKFVNILIFLIHNLLTDYFLVTLVLTWNVYLWSLQTHLVVTVYISTWVIQSIWRNTHSSLKYVTVTIKLSNKAKYFVLFFDRNRKSLNAMKELKKPQENVQTFVIEVCLPEKKWKTWSDNQSNVFFFRLEITLDSVYSLRVQFQGQFREFLFPFIMRIHPEADQTQQNNVYSQYALHEIITKTKTNPE